MMPFDNPAKISDADKLAVGAYMLARNGNMKPDTQLPTGGGQHADKVNAAHPQGVKTSRSTGRI